MDLGDTNDTARRRASSMQLAGNAQEKLELAQYFIRCYSASRQGLTRLGILRSERSLQGDYAEWLVTEHLGLQLAPSGVQKGYDAIGSDGAKYQIKSRVVASLTATTSFDIGVLRKVTDSAYALQMPMISICRRLQAQARQLLDAAQGADAKAVDQHGRQAHI